MRIHTSIIASAAVALALASLTSAAQADTTGMLLTVQSGSLTISAPVATLDFGTYTNKVGGGTISGVLGTVVVSDARTATAGSGWVATVISTAFTPTSGPTIAASHISYSSGTITKVGTAVYTDNDPPDLTGASAAVTATAITGDNSATWSPTITIAVPGGTTAGAYTATITHSVT